MSPLAAGLLLLAGVLVLVAALLEPEEGRPADPEELDREPWW